MPLLQGRIIKKKINVIGSIHPVLFSLFLSLAIPSCVGNPDHIGGVLNLDQVKVTLNKELSKQNEDVIPAFKLESHSVRVTDRLGITIAQTQIDALNESIKRDPFYPTSYIHRASLFASIGEYDKAISDYSKAMEILPENGEIWYGRAQVYKWKGEYEYEKAIADYQACVYKTRGQGTYAILSNISLSKICLSKNEYVLALNYIDKALTDDIREAFSKFEGGFFGEAYVQRANVYFYMKEYEKALTNINEALRIDPLSEDALYTRGKINYFKKDYHRAIEDLNKVYAISSKDKYQVEIGTSYYRLGDYAKAVEVYSSLILTSPQSQDAYYGRAGAYYMQNENAKAIDDYSQAIKLNAKYSEAYVARAMTYTKMEDYASAALDFNKGCELGQKTACNMFKLIEFLQKNR